MRKLAATILSPLRRAAVFRRVSAEINDRGGALRVSTLLHWLTIGLALLAATVFGAAECGRTGVQRWFAASVAIQGTAVLIAALGCRRMRDVLVVSPLLVAVAIATYGWEPVGRWFFESGRPLEIVVMTGMRNLMLGLAAAGCWRKFGQLAGLLSLFLVLFAATMASTRALDVLLAAYSAVAVWWMSVMHWDRLRATLLASQSADVPRPWIVLVPLVAIIVVAAAGLGANRALSVAAGFLSSSGGSGKYDPFAQQGVGDGDLLVAGMENIQSFAPIEDAPFRASDEPSLYDLFNDTYEEPVITKKQDRAVALPAEFSGIPESRMSQSQRANREFSTLRRRGKKQSGPVGDLKSDALFYVAGRTPLHLRMELYDLFDGVGWWSEPDEEPSIVLRVDRVLGRPWIVPTQFGRTLDSISAAETHALKIVNLDTPYIPAPLNLRGVHVDLVETESMFRWSTAGLVRMDRRKLPSLVPIHLASLVVDSSRIDRELLSLPTTDPRYGELPVGGRMPEIAGLARRWGDGQKRGWRQIAAVVSRLRASCLLDRSAPAAEENDCPVADFLLDSHRGPDYQFATAAALLLRNLGYSTRVVSGFYADLKKFDARSRHTPVERNDVHFWTEVYVGAGMWQTLEPTPGYEVLGPPPGIGEQMAAAALAVWRFVDAHAAAVFLGLAALFAAAVWRVAIQDALCTLMWRVSPVGDSRDSVLRTLRLLDRRWGWAGFRRPASRTPAGWFPQRLTLNQTERGELGTFFELADWAAFAPAGERRSATCSRDQVAMICRAAVQIGSMQRLIGAHEDCAWLPRLFGRRRLNSIPARTIECPRH
jgi:hypothetical protein